jgi:hypothetical protein
MWTAACAIIERPWYAHAKRRTFNQNQEEGREETIPGDYAADAAPTPAKTRRSRGSILDADWGSILEAD